MGTWGDTGAGCDPPSTSPPIVPPKPDPTEELETALCGAAMALGILLALLGIAMIVVARRNAHGTARMLGGGLSPSRVGKAGW